MTVAMQARPARQTPKQLYDRAIELQQQHKLDEAAACLLKASAAAPKNANIRLRLSQILLSRGDFLAGWHEFDVAYQLGIDELPKFRIPQWNGMQLKRGRILLIGDQGYGDTIQFARYIPMVAERCAKITLACSEPVLRLLEGIEGADQIVTHWKDVGLCDAYCRLTSLPYVFGTTLDTIPTGIPYIRANSQKKQAFAELLKARSQPGCLRVGIAWSGRPTHPNDKWRSMKLSQWEELLDSKDTDFIPIQKDISDADREELDRRGIVNLAAKVRDFSDTAALVDNLDLVISVDTSVVHLAGAMGKPVWVLLPWVPDWRWLYERDDTPWYPSARLFRQSAPDDWSVPVGKVVSELRMLLEKRGRTTG